MSKGIYQHKPTQGFQKGYIPYNKGTKLPKEQCVKISKNHRTYQTEETKLKLSLAHKGKKHKPQQGFQKGHKFGEANKGKKKPPFSEEHKRKIGLRSIGEKNYFFGKNKSGKDAWSWRGGTSTENEKIRGSIEIKLWRSSVFAKNGYTCQKYGIRGGDLIAHHILNFSSHKELRFAIDNGITLSKKAHDEFHKKYGKENNTREQLEEFLGYKIC